MPTASVTVDHLTQKSFPSADGRTTVARRERCERRFDQYRPLGSLNLASKHIKQWHRSYLLLLLSVLVLEDLKANQGTTGFFRTWL
jgi:hypothetical protein